MTNSISTLRPPEVTNVAQHEQDDGYGSACGKDNFLRIFCEYMGYDPDEFVKNAMEAEAERKQDAKAEKSTVRQLCNSAITNARKLRIRDGRGFDKPRTSNGKICKDVKRHRTRVKDAVRNRPPTHGGQQEWENNETFSAESGEPPVPYVSVDASDNVSAIGPIEPGPPAVPGPWEQIRANAESVLGDILARDVINHLERLVLFAYKLSADQTFEQALATCGMYLKYYVQGSVLVTVYDYIRNFCGSDLSDSVEMNLKDKFAAEAGYEEKPSEMTTGLAVVWEGLKTAKFARKIVYVIGTVSAIAACKISDVQINHSLIDEFVKAKSAEKLEAYDLLDAIVSTYHWVSTVGLACLRERSLRPLQLSTTQLYKIQARYIYWYNQRSTIFSADKTAETEALRVQMFSELKAMIEDCHKILKYKSCGTTAVLANTVVKPIVDFYESCRKVDSNVDFVEAAQGFLVWGPPGTGKSSIIPHICTCVAVGLGRKYNPKYAATINLADKYQDKLTNETETIHIDEIAPTKQEFNTTINSAVATSLALVSNTPFQPVRSDLDNKSSIVCRHYCTTMCANEEMPMRNLMTEPGAYFRRYLNILMTVKPQYQNHRGALDTDNPLFKEDDYPDVWNFDIYEIYYEGDVQYRKYIRFDWHGASRVARDINIRQLEHILISRSIKHGERERLKYKKNIEKGEQKHCLKCHTMRGCVCDKESGQTVCTDRPDDLRSTFSEHPPEPPPTDDEIEVCVTNNNHKPKKKRGGKKKTQFAPESLITTVAGAVVKASFASVNRWMAPLEWFNQILKVDEKVTGILDHELLVEINNVTDWMVAGAIANVPECVSTHRFFRYFKEKLMWAVAAQDQKLFPPWYIFKKSMAFGICVAILNFLFTMYNPAVAPANVAVTIVLLLTMSPPQVVLPLRKRAQAWATLQTLKVAQSMVNLCRGAGVLSGLYYKEKTLTEEMRQYFSKDPLPARDHIFHAIGMASPSVNIYHSFESTAGISDIPRLLARADPISPLVGDALHEASTHWAERREMIVETFTSTVITIKETLPYVPGISIFQVYLPYVARLVFAWFANPIGASILFGCVASSAMYVFLSYRAWLGAPARYRALQDKIDRSPALQQQLWDRARASAGEYNPGIVRAVGVTGVILAGLVMWNTWRKRAPEMDDGEDRKSGWFNTFNLYKAVPPVSSIAANRQPDHCLNAVDPNVITVHTDHGRCRATGIRPNVCIMPLHFFHENGDALKPRVSSIKIQTQWNSRSFLSKPHTLYPDSIVPIPGKDLCLVYLSKAATFRDLRGMLPIEKSTGATTANLVLKVDGESVHEKVCATYLPVMDTMAGDVKDVYLYKSSYTMPGHCGSPIVADRRDGAIMGFHIAGKAETFSYFTGKREGLAQSVTRSEYDRCEALLFTQNPNTPSAVPTAVPNVIMGSEVFVPGKAHPLAKVFHDGTVGQTGNVAVLGSCHLRSTAKSEIKPSLLKEAVDEHFGKQVEYGPPKFKPEWKQYNRAIQAIEEGADDVDPHVLKLAVEDYIKPLEDFALKWKEKFPDRCKPLTLDESINGIYERPHINPLEMKTSIGLPKLGRKDKVFIPLPQDDPTRPKRWAIPEDVQKEYDRIMGHYRNGERANVFSHACFKDEAVKLTKEKVRLIYVQQAAFTLVLRQFFLPVIEFLLNHPKTAECAVGINCAGPDWEDLMKFLERFAKDGLGFGLDYENYDLKRAVNVTNASLTIMIRLAKIFGFDPEAIRVMESLVIDLTNPNIDWNGTMVRVWMWISGNSLTVHGNSMDNSLLVRCCYFTELEKNNMTLPGTFRDNVALGTYGDDLKSSVHERARRIISFTIYRDYLETIGMKITTPDKKETDLGFWPLDELDFLKRKSVYIPELGCRVGAIDEASIFRQLQYCSCSTEQGAMQDDAVASIGDAIREWFLHGREIFEARRHTLRLVCESAGVYDKNLDRCFDELVHQWKENNLPAEN